MVGRDVGAWQAGVLQAQVQVSVMARWMGGGGGGSVLQIRPGATGGRVHAVATTRQQRRTGVCCSHGSDSGSRAEVGYS